MQVSTAYSNADLPRVEEKVYPPPISLETLLDMVDKEIDQELVRKLIQSKPNTYTFTKAMAEHVVDRHGCTTFPVAIFRPAIVISSLRHPFPGWIENLNGPSGVIAGVSTGLLRIVRSRGTARADMVPVDIVIDNLIVAAWETAVDKPSQVRVYNCTSMENPTTWGEFQRSINVYTPMYPSSDAILWPNLICVDNLYIHRMLENLLQTIPLHTIEYLKRIVGLKKGRDFIQINRSLQSMNKALEYFAVREWIFENYNARRLRYRLSRHDRTLFNLDPNTIDWKEVLTNFVRGTRRYVLREGDKSLVTARARMQILSLVYTVTKVLFTLTVTLRLINRWRIPLKKLIKTF